MACCSSACKKCTLFSAGVILLLGGVLAAVFWSHVVEHVYKTQLPLSPSSTGFKMWRKTPIPMYFEVRFFNWTNPDEVKAGKAKPKVQEVGPYTYEEKHTRVNITWHPENDTISFRQIREWHFVPSKSSGTLDDQIVFLNVLAATVARAIKHLPLYKKILISKFLSHVKADLAVRKTVREITFDGYEDVMLKTAAEFKKFLQSLNINITYPYDKFGWFYARNMSATYDGSFNMYTGQHNMSRLGMLHSWNDATHTPYFDGPCGDVYGTTGELMPPSKTSARLPVFISDFCSYVSLTKGKEKTEKHGIDAVRFEGQAAVFDNGTKHLENACFSYKEAPMRSGVRDVSKCRYGAPAYASFPHFLDADPWYAASVDGMSPNRTEHGFFIDLEPSSGLLLEVKAQLQINILLEPIPGLELYEKVPRALMPMFYFRQRAELTPDLAFQVKILTNLSTIGVTTFITLAGIGTLILAVAIFTIACSHKRRADAERTPLVQAAAVDWSEDNPSPPLEVY